MKPVKWMMQDLHNKHSKITQLIFWAKHNDLEENKTTILNMLNIFIHQLKGSLVSQFLILQAAH